MVQLKNQRGRFRRIHTRRHADQMVGSQRAIGGVRPDDGHIGHPVTERKAAHGIAELVDFPDDVIAHCERGPEVHRLRVEMSPDRDVGVLEARGEHADPHLAPGGCRHGSADHLQLVGTAEAPDLNNPVAWLCYGWIPCNSCSAHGQENIPRPPFVGAISLGCVGLDSCCSSCGKKVRSLTRINPPTYPREGISAADVLRR